MLAVLYAALSGASYGASDFAGAYATKKSDATLITIFVQIVSLMSLAVILIAFSPGRLITTDLWWGALGGLGAALGLATFYQALAIGPMSVAASTTALVSALVPVLAGLALGEIPGSVTMIGVALSIPAGLLVSVGGASMHMVSPNMGPRDRVRSRTGSNRTRVLSVLAGLGFGLFFVALSRTSAEGGLFPLLGARFASITVLGAILTVRRSWGLIGANQWPIVAVAGLLDCAANSFYLLALESGSFTWVAAISSLYPVSTVLLARLLLNERISPVQGFGLGLAGIALTLVATGAT